MACQTRLAVSRKFYGMCYVHRYNTACLVLNFNGLSPIQHREAKMSEHDTAKDVGTRQQLFRSYGVLFKNIFLSIKGRLSASVFVVAMVVLSSLSGLPVLLWLCEAFPQPVKSIVMAAYHLTLGWCLVALCVKRLHDRDHTGWFVLLILVPVADIFFLLYLALWRGEPVANEFGAPARPCPLLLAVVCYPIFLLAMGFSLVPDAVVMQAAQKIPAVKYLGLSAEIEQDRSRVKQLIRCLGVSDEQS